MVYFWFFAYAGELDRPKLASLSGLDITSTYLYGFLLIKMCGNFRLYLLDINFTDMNKLPCVVRWVRKNGMNL